ncbi:5-formyltetrahydrofolate cyclo-ligase [Stutzerimonas kirkiae]|uniref:5-formyltetrahydrofolate cyclo-ligase n=1 Tax=Stutzerimonas kirkiae TaxID=2211392 RepID=UPI0010384AE2|nr:5-formyltetrahydrofolate cyclo-ligase [Stutzerimonas kirkiae]TBV11881.1 5-formyltetrahydrofolate cyclo-ligase [Stutzerimonas kirkiae]
MIEAGDLSRKALRQKLRKARRALGRSEQRRASVRLYKQLAQHPTFRRARHIALYLPNDGEIDPTLLLLAAQRRGKSIYLPVLRRWPSTRMDFQRLRRNEGLELNRFRIAQPRCKPASRRPIWTLDLLLLPLVGFDEQGGRLGMGGGFYDRSLAYRRDRTQAGRPRLLGLAHECQKVDSLPLEAWDIPLHATVTDRRWYAVI